MRFAMMAIVVLSIATIGCAEFRISKEPKLVFATPVPEVPGDALYGYIESSNRSVLVQFFDQNDFGRTKSMTPHLARLADIYKESTDIVRVDVTRNTELFDSLGESTCPSYALFEQGQLEPVFFQSSPVSSDNLEAALLASLALSDMNE